LEFGLHFLWNWGFGLRCFLCCLILSFQSQLLIIIFQSQFLITNSKALHFVNEYYFVFAVFFFPVYFYFLRLYGIHSMAYIVGLHGQLAAETAVDEDEQFHFFRAAEVDECIHGRAYGAACVEHIVYEHYCFILYAERYVGVGRYLNIAALDIIAVEGDIKLAVLYFFVPGDLFDHLRDTIGQENATWLDADNNGIGERSMVFN